VQGLTLMKCANKIKSVNIKMENDR